MEGLSNPRLSRRTQRQLNSVRVCAHIQPSRLSEEIALVSTVDCVFTSITRVLHLLARNCTIGPSFLLAKTSWIWYSVALVLPTSKSFAPAPSVVPGASLIS